jgi:hypothetical protein
MLILAILIQASVPAPGGAPELNLICRTTGRTMTNVGSQTSVVRDNYGNAVAGQSVQQGLVDYDTTAGFRIHDGVATMRVPAMFLPPLHGGRGGWLKVKNLRIADTEITGKAAINFMNNPTFRIDRVTGELSMQGGFQAQCEPQDVTTRRF